MASTDEYPASTRAWRIPHVVDTIFAHSNLFFLTERLLRHGGAPQDTFLNSSYGQPLIKSIDQELAEWRSFLPLNRTVFHSAVPYAWYFAEFSRFPWNCPSRERLKAYKAALRKVSVIWSLPHCHKWTVPLLLEYFPNVQSLYFHLAIPAIDVARDESGAITALKLERDFNHWALSETGNLVPEPPHWLPSGQSYWQVAIENPSDSQDISVSPTAPSTRKAFSLQIHQHGLLNQPGPLRQHIYSLTVDPTHSFDTWLRILELRAQFGAATGAISFGQRSVTPARLLRLSQVAGAHLWKLVIGVVPANLDELFGSILVLANFPALHYVELHLDLFSTDTAEYNDDTPVEPITVEGLPQATCFIADPYIHLRFRIPHLKSDPTSLIVSDPSFGGQGDLIGALADCMPYDALEVLYDIFFMEIHLSFDSSDPSIDTVELKKQVAYRIPLYAERKTDEI